MISGLMVLNSSFIGSRDLWWVDDPDSAVVGYNVYRAYDFPTAWVKLNDTPVQGHAFRDLTTLQTIQYAVRPSDWVEQGEFGKWGFQLPDIPYCAVVEGRPAISNSPDDVSVLLDGAAFRPALVSGIDRTVWLQTAEAVHPGGAVSTMPLVKDFSTISTVTAVYKKLTNSVDIYTTLVRTFYTVVPLKADGGSPTIATEAHAPGVAGSEIVDSMQIDKMDYMLKEMVRRNSFVFEQAGEPAYLMFRKTKGTRCSCVSDLGQARTACPACFETGVVGGYYGPFDFLFIDPDSGATAEIDEGGRKVTRISQSLLGPSPVVQDGDIVVRRNGERLIISNVTYKMPRGVLCQQSFDVELLNSKDTRYLFPVIDPSRAVVVYNPADPNATGNEPVTDPGTNPAEQWENPNRPVGRTITFGRIET